MLEMLHEQGKIPSRYYAQLNGKSANENYRRFKLSKNKREGFLMSLVRSSLQAVLKTALDEIFKEFEGKK